MCLCSSETHRRALCMCAAAVLLSVFLSYQTLCPLTFGSPELSANQLRALKWRHSWDILYRRNWCHPEVPWRETEAPPPMTSQLDDCYWFCCWIKLSHQMDQCVCLYKLYGCRMPLSDATSSFHFPHLVRRHPTYPRMHHTYRQRWQDVESGYADLIVTVWPLILHCI